MAVNQARTEKVLDALKNHEPTLGPKKFGHHGLNVAFFNKSRDKKLRLKEDALKNIEEALDRARDFRRKKLSTCIQAVKLLLLPSDSVYEVAVRARKRKLTSHLDVIQLNFTQNAGDLVRDKVEATLATPTPGGWGLLTMLRNQGKGGKCDLWAAITEGMREYVQKRLLENYCKFIDGVCHECSAGGSTTFKESRLSVAKIGICSHMFVQEPTIHHRRTVSSQ